MRRFACFLLCLSLLYGLAAQSWAQTSPINGNRVLIGWLNACTTTGPANVYACTMPFLAEYRPQMCVQATVNVANTGATSLNINGIGPLWVKKWIGGTLTDLVAGDLGAGQSLEACYDGTQWQAQSLGSGGSVGTGDVTSIGGTGATGCLTGNCLDGSSTGGRAIALYDGDSNKGTLQTLNLTADRTYSLPNESGTLCTTGTVCPGYQASLGYTAESTGNKSADTALGTSDLAYPTQNAVKVYVDSSVAAAGGGDVTGVGNCNGPGACLDGQPGHGTTVSLYDGDSHAGTLQTTNLTTARTYTLPNESGTICTTGSICGSYGNVLTSGTPVSGQLAVWNDATHVQGSSTPTVTTLNKVTITPPATGATFTIADGKTVTVSNTVTLSGIDGSTVAFGVGGTVLYTNTFQTVTNKTLDLAANTVSGTTPQFNTALSDADFLTTGAGEIAGLLSKGIPVSNDLLVIEDSQQSNTKKKVLLGNLLSGASLAWGTISGTLSAQTDLQTALDAKEALANKSTNTALGTNNLLYPSQNAVKVYVDTIAATKQATVTWGAGLQAAGSTASTASTEPLFLTDGAATDLTAGLTNQGKMQVLDDGRLQYTDGATTALLWTGYLLPRPLSYSITAGTCTGDGNGGKLTINGSNQVICAADQGGAGGSGTVTSITATAPIQVTGGEITTSGVVSIADADDNGTTKGAATFTDADFNCTAGVCSIAYTTGQSASSSTKGFLTSADWTTFNNKQAALGFTAVPNTRTVNGHALSADVTVTKSDVSLGNVTDDAQLKRAASDFASFTQKATPTTSDVLLIEDAAASGAKKYVTIGTLPGFTLTVKTQDDATIVSPVNTIRVSNGTLTDETGGVVTIATGGGAGGGGDASTNTATSVTGEVALFADATGKLLGRATGSGIAVLTSGALSTVAAPTGAVVGDTDAMLLTGKDVALRVDPVTSGTSLPCNIGASDVCEQANTESAGTLTIPAPTGTPRDLQQLKYRVSCTNDQSYSFDAAFRFPGDVVQPLTCAAGSTDYWLASWNGADSVYDVLTVIQGAGTGGSLVGHLIQDEGTNLPAQPRLNCIGAGITCANNTGTGATDITVTGVGQAYATVQDEGTARTQRSTLNVVGGALSATDDSGNNRTLLALSQDPPASTAVVGTGRILTAGFGLQIDGTGAADLSTNRTIRFQPAVSDDQVFISDSSAGGTWRAVPNCPDSTGFYLNYTASTNTFSCTKHTHFFSQTTPTTSVTLQGITHQLGTAALSVTCWDNGSPRKLIPVLDLSVDTSNFNLSWSFSTAQAFHCVIRS